MLYVAVGQNRSKCNIMVYFFLLLQLTHQNGLNGKILGSKQYNLLFQSYVFYIFSLLVLLTFFGPLVFYLFGPLGSTYGPSSVWVCLKNNYKKHLDTIASFVTL